MKIALTFDDGPNEPYTRQILDVLAEFGAKATFFVIGKWARLAPEILREIAKGNHVVGNHTENHPQLSQIPNSHGEREILDCAADIYRSGQVGPQPFRAPFGDIPAWMPKDEHTPWDVHGSDWSADSVEAITQPIFERLDTGKDSIVLLHDGYYKEFGADRSKTVEATRKILERYPDASFVTISEYLA
jgi:peptidoglycan-N-acetylglucosamine deacetylase